MKQDIKLGISLYSFSTEYIHEKLDLEGVLKKAKDMGYEGIEIVAAQMVPEYPIHRIIGWQSSKVCLKNMSLNLFAGVRILIWE